ncbi:MAG: hypothetical protein IKI75_02585 [Lachnospiraceae bacterium]|nr:hypothetical protein [Lachnospiraceae bacterium]
MGIKLWIKNNLRCSYIIPLTTKYKTEGTVCFVRKALSIAMSTKVIKSSAKKRNVADDTLQLMKLVDVCYDPALTFYYHIDEKKTIAVRGNILSNFPLDYRKIIDGSFREIACLAVSAGGKYGSNARKIREAVYILHSRIVELLKKGHHTSVLRYFEDILDRKAEHFAEGLQRILFFNQIMWQTRHRLNGIGRIDRILGDLYLKDIEDGYLTKEEAYDLICDFIKCLHQNYEFKSAALMGDIGQIIILGGIGDDGNYFSNELTELFLRAHKELAYPDPKIMLRVSEKMPKSLIKKATDCLLARTGSPIFSNDDIIIKKMKEFGYAESDAYDYCVSACWEPFVSGKSLDQNNILSFNLAKVLFDHLERANLKQISSFKELIRGYDRTLFKELKAFVKRLDDYVWAEDPLVSIFTDSCTIKGKDISRGGADYNNFGFTTVGMGAVCDSLLNIRELCFRKKEYSLSALETKRKENFENDRECYDKLKALPGRFGHDEKDSIMLVNHIIHVCNMTLSEYRNRMGGKIKFGLSSPDYILSGKKETADIAGRKNGMPYSTHISADDAGYTELIGFASDISYGGCNINGNVADFFVQPNIISDNREKFEMFIEGAIKRGFYQLQMNIMDSATLIDAKKHPEKHEDLIVRVWGFSAYFNELPEDYKDQLILRALNSEKSVA